MRCSGSAVFGLSNGDIDTGPYRRYIVDEDIDIGPYRGYIVGYILFEYSGLGSKPKDFVWVPGKGPCLL